MPYTVNVWGDVFHIHKFQLQIIYRQLGGKEMFIFHSDNNI